jgi:putative glutamine amidotransferase
MLVRLAVDRQIPILGICRGIQTMAAALGGRVHQDIYAALGDGLLGHSQEEERGVATHMVNIERGSLLYTLFSDTLAVNSFHHQAIDRLGNGLIASGITGDDIVEAIEMPSHPFAVGVQWHPESMLDSAQNMKQLLHALIHYAKPD